MEVELQQVKGLASQVHGALLGESEDYDMKPVVILGGYGRAGRVIARMLLEHLPNSKVVLAGRRKAQCADRLAAELNAEYPGERASTAYVKLTDYSSLLGALRGSRMLIVASCTVGHTFTLAKAALECGVGYLDVFYGDKAMDALRPLRRSIRASRQPFVTQAGAFPGLLRVLVRHVVELLPDNTCDSVRAGVLISHPHGGPHAAYEQLDGLSEYPELCEAGLWRSASFKEQHTEMDFGAAGIHAATLITPPEVRDLPDELGIPSMSVCFASTNAFVNRFRVAPCLLLPMLRRVLGQEALARLYTHGLDQNPHDQRCAAIVAEARGCLDGRPVWVRVVVEDVDSFHLAAAGVASCLRQLAARHSLPGQKNTYDGPELMGNVVSAQQTVADLEEFGVRVEIMAG